ncbi:MAG TPA: radical SAM protein [Thermoanaerobaculia bacterium]|nr:radical SAM protein [Thermoanaerobaculia bacterium]
MNRASHGWAHVSEERKREIIASIASGKATRGPVHAEFDITDRCNVACYFCNQQDVRTKEQMSLGHLQHLVDELAASGLKSVRLSGGGDPLFHRDILAFLDHLQARGIIVDNLTTNGALLTPEIARRLVAGKAREVIFSINAVDEADYHRMMRVPLGTFTKVVNNVRGLIAARGDSPYPSVVAQFLIDRRNSGELPRMYALGRELGADRIAISNVLEIPLERIDRELLLGPQDTDLVRPGLEAILKADRDAHRLQIYFPVAEWNTVMAEIKQRIGYGPEENLFPIASSYQEKNGHCFFGWYTAVIRGTGEMYPCCLLMQPGYPPLGNAVNGRFVDQWNGPGFTRLREEQRQVFLQGEAAKYDPVKHQVLKECCVEVGKCWLKNIYFRGDEKFYADLGRALEKARRRDRLRRLPTRAYWKAKTTLMDLKASLRGRAQPGA